MERQRAVVLGSESTGSTTLRRDGEHVRGPMTDWFRQALGVRPAPWIEVTGDPRSRVDAVLARLDQRPTLPA